MRSTNDGQSHGTTAANPLQGQTLSETGATPTSLSCPVNLDTAKLREAVREMYQRVAREPGGEFHFHRGPDYAARALGYDAAELAELPASSTRSFAGVGNPHAVGPLGPGETVLDIGCGAGTDLLLAARQVGPSGRAIGVDMTDEMIEASRAGARRLGLHHVDVRRGDLHELPLEDSSVDVVISNGVLNLAEDKRRAFAEIVRVLRPGGRLRLADIAVRSPLDESIRRNYELWAT